MRKLATIRKIKDIQPIEGADAIVVAVIDGWKVVVKKDTFNVGDTCVYFEIDTFLRDGVPMWQFLVDKSSRNFEGQRGHVLRTVTLRGQISQGLVLPVDDAVAMFTDSQFDEGQELSEVFYLGADVTDILGVKKWEPEIPAELAGQVEGPFPRFIRKTDQERCQNIPDEIFSTHAGASYEVSIKLDGTSCTIYYNDGRLGVCGRNWEYKLNEANAGNALIRAMYENALDVSLPKLGRNLAVQGEVMGPGIQNNREKLKASKFFVFDIYDIDAKRYLTPEERMGVFAQLQADCPNLSHVPIEYDNVTLAELGIGDVDQLITAADGPSLVNQVREGRVYKKVGGGFSFKTISNKYLKEVKG